MQASVLRLRFDNFNCLFKSGLWLFVQLSKLLAIVHKQLSAGGFMAYMLKATTIFVCAVLTGCSFQQNSSQYSSYKCNLSKPDLGPIIGKTTPIGFRVWVKSEEGGEIGFFRYRLAGSNASYSVPVKFKTASQWYTGIGLFDIEPVGAEPGEVFEYQVGFLKYPEVIGSCKSMLSCLKWQGAGGGRVRLFPKEGSSQGTRFVVVQ